MIERLSFQDLLSNNMVVDITDSLESAMKKMDLNAQRILFVTSNTTALLGTITDGDIRRALLRGAEMNDDLELAVHRNCLVLPIGTALPHAANILNLHQLIGLPFVDSQGGLDGALLKPVSRIPALTLIQQTPVLVMAGGEGRRLRPLTASVPKPLVPLNGTTPLDILLHRLSNFGFRKITIATYFLSELVQQHVGDGSEIDVEIDYIVEESPLGTAGALGMMDLESESSVLVLNSDIVSDAPLDSLVQASLDSPNDTFVGVVEHSSPIPYGVIRAQEEKVVAIVEKPTLRHNVLTGITLVAPMTRALVTRGEALDMTSLLNRALRAGQVVRAFNLNSFWVDIGSYETLRGLEVNPPKKATAVSNE